MKSESIEKVREIRDGCQWRRLRGEWRLRRRRRQ